MPAHEGAARLPTPRLTALIDSVGNVRIVGEELERPMGGAIGSTNKPCVCTACGQRGHTRANKRCPARGG